MEEYRACCILTLVFQCFQFLSRLKNILSLFSVRHCACPIKNNCLTHFLKLQHFYHLFKQLLSKRCDGFINIDRSCVFNPPDEVPSTACLPSQSDEIVSYVVITDAQDVMKAVSHPQVNFLTGHDDGKSSESESDTVRTTTLIKVYYFIKNNNYFLLS